MSLRYSLHTSAEKTMTIADTPTGAHMSNISGVQRSPWHSPVPYLFGGLAAMLGLIAFALLVLACSYWRLSGHLENERDVEAGGESNGGDGAEADDVKKTAPSAPVVYEEKFLVIMPGQQKPTCLATPMWSRASSFGSTSTSKSSCSSSSSNSEGSSSFGENKEKMQQLQESSGLVHHHLQMSGGLTTNPTPTHHQQGVSSGYIAQS